MPPKPSLKTIAASLGITTTAVSMALRGKPGVSEALRARVVACAEKAGYRPDAAVVELMTLVRAHRQMEPQGNTVAYVTNFSDPGLTDRIHTFHDFLEGAVQRGKKYGYTVQPFHARAPGMTPARLVQILKARGVRGIILGPRWHDEPALELDLSAFSVVLVGEVVHRPGVYRICNHHTQSCCLTLHKLTALGYRRIAAVLPLKFESSRGYEYMLGVDQFNREIKRSRTVTIWQYDTWDAAAFKTWARKNNIDAAVTYDREAWLTLTSLETAEGEPVGCANLDVPPGSGWSGINQHSAAIGETAMDLLRQLLLNGERGAFTHPQIVLIDGTWVDGTTTRPAPAKAAPAAVVRRKKPSARRSRPER